MKKKPATPVGPKFPEITLELRPNAMLIIGKVRIALKKAGKPDSVIDDFLNDANTDKSSDFVALAKRWVTVVELEK